MEQSFDDRMPFLASTTWDVVSNSIKTIHTIVMVDVQYTGIGCLYSGEFFSKSCVPGVLNKEYNSQGSNPINLCEACSSGGSERCQRNDDELYYGNSGAFRCLTECRSQWQQTLLPI